MQNLTNKVTNPGTSGTKVAYEDGGDILIKDFSRFMLVLSSNQNVAVNSYWAQDSTSTLIARQADTYVTTEGIKMFDFVLLPGRNKIEIVSTTAPTEWQCIGMLTPERGVSN